MSLFKKILFIPRAVVDVGKVFFTKNVSFSQKCSLSKSLLQLKILANTKGLNTPILFAINNKKVWAYNHTNLQFLLKEIFIEKKYKINDKQALNILDAGSNIGLSIIYFKSIFKEAKIKAFEPDESSFKLLEKNITQNNYQNIELNKKAISNTNESFFTNSTFNFGSVNSNFEKNETGIKIESVRLVDLLEEKYDIIKLDIEGWEWIVLYDVMENNKLNASKNWLIEFHGANKELEIGKIKFQFQKNGFKLEERGEIIYFYKN